MILEDVNVEHDELVSAAKEQWFGCNDIEILGGHTMENGSEVVFICNVTTDKTHRFFLKRSSETGLLVLEEYPWA